MKRIGLVIGLALGCTPDNAPVSEPKQERPPAAAEQPTANIRTQVNRDSAFDWAFHTFSSIRRGRTLREECPDFKGDDCLLKFGSTWVMALESEPFFVVHFQYGSEEERDRALRELRSFLVEKDAAPRADGSLFFDGSPGWCGENERSTILCRLDLVHRTEVGNVVPVTAVQLARECEQDEVAFLERYTDKRLRVTGVVDARPKKDETLLLTAGKTEIPTGGLSREYMSKVRKGETITIVCDEVIEAMGGPWLFKCSEVVSN